MYSIVNALIPTPLPIFLIIVAIFSLMNTAIPIWLTGCGATLKGLYRHAGLSLIVTVMSYIGAKANPAGSIGGQAYFQYSNLALLQLLSITGMWGVVFLVNWLGRSLIMPGRGVSPGKKSGKCLDPCRDRTGSLSIWWVCGWPMPRRLPAR